MRAAFLLISLLAGLAWSQEGLIRPGDGIGPVKRSMIRGDLDRVVPPEALFDGTTADWPTTTLWANEREKRITVFWGPQGSIFKLMIAGRPPSLWRTSEGITLGTTARELEQLNGKPFVLYAFTGKRDGEIRDWQEGRLAGSLPGVELALTMSVPGYSALTGEQKELLEKEGRLLSSDPVIVALNPAVQRIELKF